MEKLILSDFDGTMLSDEKKIGKKDFETLNFLKTQNAVTALATGRSLFSLRKVISKDFPIDYVIFSCGAGIINWKTQEIIYKQELSEIHTKEISEILLQNETDFMIHEKIPQNHQFSYSYNSKGENSDFFRRIELYKNCNREINFKNYLFGDSTQVVSIFPNTHREKFHKLKEKFGKFSVIRATSPLDNKSIWMEIFNEKVSKSQSAERLSNFLKIDRKNTMAIGNDFNDEDLLEWAEKSFVVENSPNELKNKFKITVSNNKNGFSQAVEEFLK